MTANFTDFSAFGQESIDTIVKANTAAAKGFEQFTKYFTDFATKSFEDAVEAGKKLQAAKTPVEFFQIQSQIAQSSFESLVDEGKKVSEMTASIFKDVSAPVAEKFKVVAKTAAKKAA